MGRGCHQWGVVFCLLQHKNQGSFTAFSASSTEEGWEKQTIASEFPAVQQATNDRQKRLVTAWCCFPQCWVVTWNVVPKSLCTWVVDVTNEVWCFACSNKNPRKFHGVQFNFHWRRLTKANQLHQNVQQATNDRQKRLVMAWCCFSQCLFLTWLLGEHESWMTRGILRDEKSVIVANSEHVIWQILSNSASDGELWMLVWNLDACANFASGSIMSGKFWSNLVSPVDAPPSFPALYQRTGCMRRHTWIHPEGRGWNEMRWNHVMSCYHVSMSCLHGWPMA